jgi:hypothetical protein
MRTGLQDDRNAMEMEKDCDDSNTMDESYPNERHRREPIFFRRSAIANRLRLARETGFEVEDI